MAAKKFVEKPAEIVPVKGERNDYIRIIRYGSSFKCAHAILSYEDGTSGPIVFSMFGDDSFYLKRMRTCWKAFLKEDPSRSEGMDEEAGTVGWLARAFVRWLNSGGERRLALARAARHGRA
jgi:hypothetical protein